MSFIELARRDKMALHTLVYFSIKSTINQEFLSTSLFFMIFLSLLFQENVAKNYKEIKRKATASKKTPRRKRNGKKQKHSSAYLPYGTKCLWF